MLIYEHRMKLYRERHDWASWESDLAELKMYIRVDGFLWRILTWLERQAEAKRLEIQAEIDELGY